MSNRDELVVKEIDFMGDTLVAAKDKNGVIWAGVSYICNGIGLSKTQKDTQVDKVQKDMLLKRGCRKFPAGVFDGNNETVALKMDFIPMWLAKISITPLMRENTPELAEKLIKYQLKAKDVLAEAFLPKYKNPEKNYDTKSTSLGEVASYTKEMDKRMDKQGSEPYKVCEAFKMVSEQFGIRLPDDFVKVPEYKQTSLFDGISQRNGGCNEI